MKNLNIVILVFKIIILLIIYWRSNDFNFIFFNELLRDDEVRNYMIQKIEEQKQIEKRLAIELEAQRVDEEFQRVVVPFYEKNKSYLIFAAWASVTLLIIYVLCQIPPSPPDPEPDPEPSPRRRHPTLKNVTYLHVTHTTPIVPNPEEPPYVAPEGHERPDFPHYGACCPPWPKNKRMF